LGLQGIPVLNRLDHETKVAVIGLGYVGLQLAVAFSRHLPTIGFDVNPDRISELRQGVDHNGEVDASEMSSDLLELSSDESALTTADTFIVAVPTPVDEHSKPDVSYLVDSSTLVGKAIARRKPSERVPTVVYESTVYPGCTDEVCVPVLECESGLKAGTGFTVGYSPERTNFGDRKHNLSNVVKVVAGQDARTTTFISALYRKIVEAGVHEAPNIRTAEAAKVIENIQRDLNIALMNELFLIFDRMDIDTNAVLEAASTKWNFHSYKPGLVGGHCIPVDPYYLAYKAREIGSNAELILAGRRINNSMAHTVATKTASLLSEAGRPITSARILVLGATFKPDIRDARNSQVRSLGHRLLDGGAAVDVFDPLVDDARISGMGLNPIADPFLSGSTYDAVVLAVGHSGFISRPVDDFLGLFEAGGKPDVLIDIGKNLTLSSDQFRNVLYWGI
jgi:UDP-N-acetyl-D-galactosamine dehydrogenase